MSMTIAAEISRETMSQVNRPDKDLTATGKVRLFKDYFQRIYHRHNLRYSKVKDVISCNNFPFHWTSFEYDGAIKISFQSTSGFNYKSFRKESIDEFNNRFRNHRASWRHPYNAIIIYGDAISHGIRSTDVYVTIAYHIWLIEEVTKFLEMREKVLLKTSLYKVANHSINC